MCGVCGCGEPETKSEIKSQRVISIEEDIMAKNQMYAD